MERIPLRDYQTAAKKQVTDSWKSINNSLLYLPTGAGKTSVVADIAADIYEANKTALVVAPRRELVYQLHQRLEQYHVRSGVIMGAKYGYIGDRVNVASIQTLNNRVFPPADYVFIDEAHHAILEGIQFSRFYEHYNGKAKILGLTATPIRLDNKPLGSVFQELIIPIVDEQEVNVQFLVDNGWLVPAKYYDSSMGIPIKSSDIKMGHEKQLYASLNKKVLYQGVVDNYLKYLANKKALCFCINVEHSLTTAKEFNERGIRCWHLDGKTELAERKRILWQFEQATDGVLCNVGILTEGYDMPDIAGVIGFRPTDSESLWLQIIGRALRPIWPKGFNANKATASERKAIIASSEKPFAIVIDQGENCQRLGTANMPREYSLTKPRDKKATLPPMRLCKESEDGCGRIFNIITEGPNCPECGKEFINNKSIKTEPIKKNGELSEVVIEQIPLPAHLNKLTKTLSLVELEELRALKKYSLGWVELQLLIRAKESAKTTLLKKYSPPIERSIVQQEEYEQYKAHVTEYAGIITATKKQYKKEWIERVLHKFLNN